MKTGLLKSTKLAGGLGLLLALVLLLTIGIPASGQLPGVPHVFFGTSHLCGTPQDVTAQIQGTDLTWTFEVDGAGYFEDSVPPDSGTGDKDGGEDGDIVDLIVMGQVLFSTEWAAAKTNGGPPYPVPPLDLDALPYLTTSSDDNGSVDTPGEGTFGPYSCGEDVSIVATPDTGYVFDEWTGDTGTIDDTEAASTTIQMNGIYSITATFIPEGPTCELTTASTVGGSVTTPAVSPYTTTCGTDVDIVATPDTGYVFTEWTGSTAAVDAIDDPSAASTFITLDDDYSITANFALETETCELTTASTAGGSVTTPAVSPYITTCGTDVDIVATPEDCYEFTGWTGSTAAVDAIDDPSAASTFITLDDDYSITANFALKVVELTTDSTAGGYVDVPGEEGPYPYDCGTVVPITALAVGCYNFTGWTGEVTTVDNVSAASTFITMDDDYSITANFELATELEDVEIPFNIGWNTFSTPIYLHDCVDTWDEFNLANSLDIYMIYGYDAATEQWVTVDGEEEIEPLYGFYVRTLSEGMAHIIPSGDKNSLPTRDLSRGVHLIGVAPASMGDYDVVSALTTIYEAANGYMGYTLVVSPYINSPNDWSYVRDGADPPDTNIGRAYWLVMENADQYVGETSTPYEP